MMYSKAFTTNDILILTDYSKKSGLGNYIRSNYIFDILKKNKYLNVDFTVFSISNKKSLKYDLIILDLPSKKYDISKLIKKIFKTKYKSNRS